MIIPTEQQRLSREFYEEPTITVSQNLLGKILVMNNHLAVIMETEAYLGYPQDQACYGHRHRTPRTEGFFGKAGFSYIYKIYAKYHCFNIVTERENEPSSVLIRGAKLITPPFTYLNGPGKLCQFLAIDTALDQLDLTTSQQLYVMNSDMKLPFKSTPRIGITRDADKPWRFIAYIKDLPSI